MATAAKKMGDHQRGAGRVRPSIGRQTVAGDGFAIGGGHVPHAGRRNVDITYLLFDNDIYGLTKGQTSLTSAVGFRTPTSPYDNPGHPQRMIAAAMSHRGFFYLHILSPSVTFDKTRRTYSNLGMAVRDLSADHDPSDRLAAMREARHDKTLALYLYFREERPTLGDSLDGLVEKSGGEIVAKAAMVKPARKTLRR